MEEKLIDKVKKFYDNPRPNISMVLLHKVFVEETKTAISYSHFCMLSKECTSVKTVRTGAAEIKLKQLAEVISERASFDINAFNCISIDEKPFVLKHYMVRSARVRKEHKGSLYESMLYGYKQKPFYLIAAVTCYGVISYRLYDDPITTSDFQSFLIHVVTTHSFDRTMFLLFDNASFHGIDDITAQIIGENNFNITKTPPSGCFTDPIEEFFAIVHSQFKRLYQEEVVRHGVYNTLSRGQVKNLIQKAIDLSDRNLLSQFRRALL